MDDPKLEIRREPFDGPVARTLVARVHQECLARYGDPDSTPVSAGEFVVPYGVFLVGYLDGAPIACGGYRIRDGGDAEVKRIYVDPALRGRGFGRSLLDALENSARRAGCRRVVLGTGVLQPEAIILYEAAGYVRIPAFGGYASFGSRCYAKSLSVPTGTPTAGLHRR